MNIYVALSLFSLIVLIYWIISEFFTILFRLSGLPEERARFQVVSLLTNCGYTTKESEIFLSSRRRRRIARMTMLFGYVFNITIVSAIINVFLSLNSAEFGSQFLAILIPLATAALLILVVRLPVFRRLGNRVFQKVAGKVFRQEENTNPVLLLDHLGADSIAQVTLMHMPEIIAGRTLAQSRLRSETGILVMLVERDGRKPFAPDPDTVFAEGDKLTLFGDYPAICRIFHAKEHFTDQ